MSRIYRVDVNIKSLQVVCKEDKKLHHTCARFHYWVAFGLQGSFHPQDFPRDITSTKEMTNDREIGKLGEQNLH